MADFFIVKDTGIVQVNDSTALGTRSGYQQKVSIFHENLGDIIISFADVALSSSLYGYDKVCETKIFEADEKGEMVFGSCFWEGASVEEALEALKTM